ncbi:uncharacterized protein TOT_030000550 [Theileria orientalis strain Shintoku]|uniref:non-specific serine/threonine protein kinase n=1 Tax=Theileria orientalis strain Shintoku TaxID=869250 RepID=J4CDK2_THEOR|nr:uncharacterized protein TOT_030000550 [Theileria orientalis strain Shintoku]BAM41287.1 uncharacterized protein TOT_030000550 [Theileria orientalis strain Shintoku]|eukprot:XP_009691588.1 uncharacterized protein TOT_030000550 [Theileria orientalis strain Shintoku]
MNDYSKESSNLQMERKVCISTPGDLKHTPLESSELRAGQKAQMLRRNEFQFMESISTQSGEDDFLKRNVEDSAVNSEKSVCLDSTNSVPGNEFKLGECKYLDPKQEIVNSQFSLNLSLLKRLSLSGTKLGGSPLKSDRAAQQPQKNLYVKGTNEPLPLKRYPSQESEYSQRSDMQSADSSRLSLCKEGFITPKDRLASEKQKFTLVKNHFNSGKQPLSSRSNESRDSFKSCDRYKNAPEHGMFQDSRAAQMEGSRPFHKSFKAASPSEQPMHSPSTHVDKSLTQSHLVSRAVHSSPKYTHRTLKDVKLTSPRDHKHSSHEYQNSHKHTQQSFKHIQYLPRDSDHGGKHTRLTSLKGAARPAKDPQKAQRHSHQPVFEEKARDLLSFVNDSNLGSQKQAQKPSRDDRKVHNGALAQPMGSPYLRNPAARVRNVHFWFKPFSTSKSSSLNAYNGLQVIESLTGNVQKSWHLEAIKGLDRNNYGELKMTMLRLSNSTFNLHPNRLLIRCRGSWDTIQEGSFGTVYLGFVEGLGNSAVKVPNAAMLNYDPVGVMKRFINEWDILSRCSHRNIVGIHGGIILGVFDIWLCTELVNGVDLHTVKYGSAYSFGSQIHQMLSGASASQQAFPGPGGHNVSANANAHLLCAPGVGSGNASSKNSSQLLGGGVAPSRKAQEGAKGVQQAYAGGVGGKAIGGANAAGSGLHQPFASNKARPAAYQLYAGLPGGLSGASLGLKAGAAPGSHGVKPVRAGVVNFKSASGASAAAALAGSTSGTTAGVTAGTTARAGVATTAAGAALASTTTPRGGATTSKLPSRTPRLIPPSAALKMCHQLADALVYLHTPCPGKGIVVHRDIKPENIIVDSEWNIKLCDFGDAFETSSGLISSVSGATWLYAPPELLLHPSISYPLTEKWDIWSFGCVVQEMFGYSGPFHHVVSMSDPPTVVCEKMVSAALRGLVPNIPNQLAKTKMGALILQCLDPVPDNRPSALDIKLMLQNSDILSP